MDYPLFALTFLLLFTHSSSLFLVHPRTITHDHVIVATGGSIGRGGGDKVLFVPGTSVQPGLTVVDTIIHHPIFKMLLLTHALTHSHFFTRHHLQASKQTNKMHTHTHTHDKRELKTCLLLLLCSLAAWTPHFAVLKVTGLHLRQSFHLRPHEVEVDGDSKGLHLSLHSRLAQQRSRTIFFFHCP